MPYISNLRSTTGTEIVCANAGDSIDECIAIAMSEVTNPRKAFAYIDHGGIIVTVDKESTADTVLADWKHRLATAHNVRMSAIGAAAGIDWDKYDAAHGR